MHIIDNSYWVVFMDTLDWAKVNETIETAEKDLLGTRYWVTKITGEETFIGTGDYGGPIPDIGAIQMEPSELAILSHSPRWGIVTYEGLKEYNTDFMPSQTEFKDNVLQILQSLMIQANATPSKIKTAYTNLATFATSLKVLDFDNAYTELSSVAVNDSFTDPIKTDITSLLFSHLEKYPR